MHVTHPNAGEGDGVPPAQVDVDGTSVPVDEDGVFEVPGDRESWLKRFAVRYDVEPETLVVDFVPPDELEAPFDPSDHTAAELTEALADGDYSDEELAALADAESEGDDRSGALDAIEDEKED